MKNQHKDNPNSTSWLLRTRLADSDHRLDSSATKDQSSKHPVAVGASGRPLGWIERTLLAVDSSRVFIEVADARLREELAAEYEAEKRDMIIASDSQALLRFTEQLPIPTEPANDMVVAEDDFSGTIASELRRQLKAHGWEIPVFTVWNQLPCGEREVAS